MPWMNIKCAKCGHESDIDNFTHTTISGTLPLNIFQCPKCQYAFERKNGKSTVYPSGFVMPGKITLVQVTARL